VNAEEKYHPPPRSSGLFRTQLWLLVVVVVVVVVVAAAAAAAVDARGSSELLACVAHYHPNPNHTALVKGVGLRFNRLLLS
jgi:hypothetical protein